MADKTILVVDDDENQRFLCQEILTEEGYDVILAENGKQALRIVEERNPDLVILDIVMPEMDGMEAMPRILRKHRTTPLILYTNYSGYMEDFMTWLADGYVVKSPDLSQLKAKVRKCLSMSYGRVE